MANNTIDRELISAIEKANKLGINIITDGTRPSAKCLSIMINEDVLGGVNQVAFEMVGENGETINRRSPFTWEMNKENFLKWIAVAYKQPLKRINQVIARMVRLMPLEKFDALRRIENLERKTIEMLRNELAVLGINPKGITLPMLSHLELIYGGIIGRPHGDEMFLDTMFDMVIEGIYKPDKCRSCRYCDNDGEKRFCRNPLNEGFSLPMDTTIGNIITDFPDLQVRVVGTKGYAYTKYIPGNQKTCEYYNRRF